MPETEHHFSHCIEIPYPVDDKTLCFSQFTDKKLESWRGEVTCSPRFPVERVGAGIHGCALTRAGLLLPHSAGLPLMEPPSNLATIYKSSWEKVFLLPRRNIVFIHIYMGDQQTTNLWEVRHKNGALGREG